MQNGEPAKVVSNEDCFPNGRNEFFRKKDIHDSKLYSDTVFSRLLERGYSYYENDLEGEEENCNGDRHISDNF